MKVLCVLPLYTRASANEASDSYLHFYNSLDLQVEKELKLLFLLQALVSLSLGKQSLHNNCSPNCKY